MKVLVIMGATATGKSSLGVQLAKRLNGEIISADSIQVYKELNIGSAKITVEEMDEINHHWISAKTLDQPASVADFQKEARVLIEQITTRGKLPIVVGGTGLYIKALLYDYQFRLDAKETLDLSSYSNQELYTQVQNLDPQQAEKIHPNNRKRLERFVQSYHQQGKTRTEILRQQKPEILYDSKIFYLTGPREWLRARFKARIQQMIDLGLPQEVYEVSQEGKDFSPVGLAAIGYRQWEPFFKKEMSLEEVIESIETATAQFSKRQMTWFRNQLEGTLIDVSQHNPLEQVMAEVKTWI